MKLIHNYAPVGFHDLDEPECKMFGVTCVQTDQQFRHYTINCLRDETVSAPLDHCCAMPKGHFHSQKLYFDIYRSDPRSEMAIAMAPSATKSPPFYLGALQRLMTSHQLTSA
jgi:hypothetical protein